MPYKQEDIESRVRQYRSQVVASFVEWDILHFFATNPQVSDDIEGIARHIGRDGEQVEEALLALKSRGLLEVRKRDAVEVFSFPEKREPAQLVQEFMDFCKNPENRLRIVYSLLSQDE